MWELFIRNYSCRTERELFTGLSESGEPGSGLAHTTPGTPRRGGGGAEIYCLKRLHISPVCRDLEGPRPA